jgi:hypothetical protein
VEGEECVVHAAGDAEVYPAQEVEAGVIASRTLFRPRLDGLEAALSSATQNIESMIHSDSVHTVDGRR